MGLFNPVPGGQVFLEFRPGRDVFPQLLFGASFAVHQVRIQNSGQGPFVGLATVLDAEQLVLGAAGVLLAAGAVNAQQNLPAVEPLQDGGKAMVARVFEFGDGEQAAGAPRMSGNENQFVLAGAGLAPVQVMLNLRRLAVFVGAEKADIQIVAREFEVVRVAAEEGDLLFRREDQPHIGVLFEAIKVILAALVQGH